MVPRKFNIVEFGGFDLAGQYGEALPGIYDKIVDAHWNCVYIMCFGLKFGGFDIAPQYMIPEMFSDHIMLNGIISIDRDDIITIPGIQPAPVEPVIVPLSVNENGEYNAPEGVDGYDPVEVDVEYPEPVITPFSTDENGTFYVPEGVDGYNPITVDVSGSSGPTLPPQYQEVEYLTYSGAQYSLVENLPESYLLHVLFSVNTTGELVAVGYREADNSPQDFEVRSNSGAFGLWIRDSTYGRVYAPSFPSDSSTVASASKEVIVSLTQPRRKFFIGKYNATTSSYSLKGRIYHINIYPAQISGSFTNFNPVMEFVACYRKSDNEPGFYELHTQTFYTNQGTGAIIVGPDVN